VADADERTCNVRVPDNGDTYRCGLPAVRGNFCAEHLPGAIEYGRKRIDETLTSLQVVIARQAELEGVETSKLLVSAAHRIEAKALLAVFRETRHLDLEAAEKALHRADELLKQYGG